MEVINPYASDHNPLLVHYHKYLTFKVKTFQFQAAWMLHHEFQNLVAHTWTSTRGDTIFNRETFDNILIHKRDLEARIKGVHQLLDRSPTFDMIQLEKALQRQYNDVLAREESLWFQKSREQWVKFGNHNTIFPYLDHY